MCIREKLMQWKAMKYYKNYYVSHKNEINRLICFYLKKKKHIALWGGGLKGIAFLNIFDPKHSRISCVYDISKEKNGTKMSTGHIICLPETKKYKEVEVIFIMNNIYETEIAGILKDLKRKVILINIDSIILGNLDISQTLKMYGRKLE